MEDNAKDIRRTLRYIIMECLAKKPPVVILDDDMSGLVTAADEVVERILYEIDGLFHAIYGMKIIKAPTSPVQGITKARELATDAFLESIAQQANHSCPAATS